jgi:hypothetical protein
MAVLPSSEHQRENDGAGGDDRQRPQDQDQLVLPHVLSKK